MPMMHLVSWFVGSALLTNAIPHLVAGVQGRRFQTPFATPPGVGESSSRTNVIWAFINIVAGWVLLFQVGTVDPHRWTDGAAIGAGVMLMALFLAGYFGRFHGGNG